MQMTLYSAPETEVSSIAIEAHRGSSLGGGFCMDGGIAAIQAPTIQDLAALLRTWCIGKALAAQSWRISSTPRLLSRCRCHPGLGGVQGFQTMYGLGSFGSAIFSISYIGKNEGKRVIQWDFLRMSAIFCIQCCSLIS